jgi:hypothetical protein
MSVFDTIASRVISQMSSRMPSLGAVGSSIGGALIGKYAPKAIAGPLARALRGDIAGAVTDGMTGFLTGALAGALGKNRLLGGITLKEAARIHAEVQSTNYAKKNLWYLEIGDWNPEGGFEDISHTFNMFATDVAYTPWTISSEGKAIGMGAIDVINGSERIEMRITTYDDTSGTIKRWFNGKCNAVAHPDGTLGLPVDYLVTINVVHSATDEIGGALFGSYKETYVMRPSSVEFELSRSEDGLQQLQMTFSQFDTFMYQGLK